MKMTANKPLVRPLTRRRRFASENRLALTPHLLGLVICWILTGCAGSGGGIGGGTTTGNPVVTEDTSASGAAASAVGGALSGTSANGTVAINQLPRQRELSPILNLFNYSLNLPAYANSYCPTYHAAAAAGRCAESGQALTYTYNNCDFVGSQATWNGFLQLTASSGTVQCGSFPEPAANGTLYRQYVSSSTTTTPAQATVENVFGTIATIDDATVNLNNFDNATVSPILNGGYGASVLFDANGARTSLTVAHRLYTSSTLDHSVTGTLNISETAGATSRAINGSIQVYHNKLRVVGTSTFTNVIHQDGCCLPISGSISTVFQRGSTAPTVAGLAAVGKTETLTFQSCGVANLVSYDGTTSTVNLSRCY